MRHLAIAAVVGVLLGACTPAAEPPPEKVATADPGTGEATPTPSPEVTLEPTQTCDGVGKPPRRGEITFVRGDRLVGVSPDGTEERCLADFDGLDLFPSAPRRTAWNGSGDRVIVGGRALSSDLTGTRRLADEPSLEWSRPSGTSVVWVDDDGHLMKRSSFGGKAIDISFLARHDDVTYHPAGTHIATSGQRSDGSYGLFLATNVGTEPKLLARGEKARFIGNLAFAEDGRLLYYSARHGPKNWHLHRLLIGQKASLQTIARRSTDFDYVVSSLDPWLVAWSVMGDCAAGKPGILRTGYRKLEIPDELRDTNLRPVGWLSHSKLVVTSSLISCSTAAPQDVYVLSRKQAPVLIAEETGASAGIRMKMPRPPPPPGEEQEVVA